VILGVDVGTRTFGWAVVTERPGPIRVLELGDLYQPDGGKGGAPNAIRVHAQALLVRGIVGRHGITTIAAEARSIGGHQGARVAMAAAQSSCWGMLATIAAKVWQGAVLGRDDGKAIDYAEVEHALASYVIGRAKEQLAAIPKWRRNHPLDGGGVGILMAVRPRLAMVVVAGAQAEKGTNTSPMTNGSTPCQTARVRRTDKGPGR
jgi:hypothetical protein